MIDKCDLSQLESYILVITEKPDAAARIARALDADGRPTKKIDNGVPFYVATRNKEIVIVPSMGHLYTVGDQKKKRTSYPVFEYTWIPLYEAERKAKMIRSWITTISKLAKNAEVFVDACDFDIEGSIAGYNTLKFACEGKQNSAKRMKYSTLTKGEIERAYLEALPTLDFSLIEAGLARHEVDWLYGVNLSRALTNAARKTSGAYTTISAGRVQGPTLKFITRREKNIHSFVPTPYWTIRAVIGLGSSILEVDYEKKTIDVKEEAERVVKSCIGKSGNIETIEITKFEQAPPPPFDLSSLQNEAYRLFRYTPMQTSRISQRLYLDALISYPRTSSQKLPSTIGYEAILKQLLKSSDYKEYAADLLAKSRLEPKEGKGEDPAHPAIYPSGNLPERTHGNADRNIWNLVVGRFMASFGDHAIGRNAKATIEVEGHRFHANSVEIIDDGWIRYYRPYMHSFTKFLPPMKKGEVVKVREIAVKEKFTRPPPRYNPSTILRKMQKEGIGTKATRAGTVQTLYDRKFIRGKNIEVTELGLEVVDVLVTNCPSIASPELTRTLEEKMTLIQQGKVAREDVIREVIEILKPITEKLKDKEQTIGKQLSQAIGKARLEDRVIGKCPTCKTGRLLIIRSKKTSKRFLGCTQYFEGKCKTSFPLPQQGLIRPSGTCRNCGWSKIRILMKGRHPWNLCFNPECPSKKKDGLI